VRVYRYALRRTFWDPDQAEERGMAKGAGIRTIPLGSIPICDRCILEARAFDERVKSEKWRRPIRRRTETVAQEKI
jgi:hypothetical protein